MPGLGVSFLARRARSSWLLLACVAVTVLLATGLATVLWTFAAAAIPAGAERILAAPQGRVVGLSGVVDDAGGVATDSGQVRATLRKAWPGIGYQMQSAVWANPIPLSPPRAVRAEASPVPNTPQPIEWQLQPAALDGIRAQTVLTAGTWPGPPQRGDPLPVALPVAVARRLHAVPGSVLKTATRSGPASAGLRVTGVFRVKNPASPYWAMDLVGVSGFEVSVLPGQGPPGSLVVYGPAVVNPAAFRSGLAASQGSWFVLPQAAALAQGNIGVLAPKTSQALTNLTTLVLPSGLQVTTRLPQVLAGIASTITLARSLFTIGALALLLVAAAALVLAARLLASMRDEESALLRARGATRWQLMRPVLAEALVVAAVASVVGVLAGVRLTGPLAGLGGIHLDSGQATRISPLAWLSALIMVVVCAAVMAWPALHAGTPDAARARQGRQARLAGVAWAGGDLAVVALAALAIWQLRGYSAVAHPAAGPLGVDPAVAIAPALALAGVALIPLRTLPLLARVTDRATDHGRRLAAAMVSWQIARRPIRQAGPVLLVVVATATTTLALAGYQSWHQSAADQAAFAVGADVRVNATQAAPLNTETIAREQGVTAATPASIFSMGSTGQLIALDAASAGSAILLRPDLSPVPVSKLWQSITPRHKPGLVLPGRPDRLQVLATLGAGPGTSAAEVRKKVGSAQVTAVDPGCRRNHLLAARRGPAGRRPAARAGRPAVRSAGWFATGQLPDAAAQPQPHLCPAAVQPGAAGPSASLTIGSLAVARTAHGSFGRSFSDGAALAAWQGAGSSPSVPTGPPGQFGTPAADGAPPYILGWHRAAGGSQQLTFNAGHDPSLAIMNNELIAPGSIIGTVSDRGAAAVRVRPGHRHQRLPGRHPAAHRIAPHHPGRRILGPAPDRGVGDQVPDRFRAEPGADRRPRVGQRRARRRPGDALAGDHVVAEHPGRPGTPLAGRAVRRRPRRPGGNPAAQCAADHAQAGPAGHRAGGGAARRARLLGQRRGQPAHPADAACGVRRDGGGPAGPRPASCAWNSSRSAFRPPRWACSPASAWPG